MTYYDQNSVVFDMPNPEAPEDRHTSKPYGAVGASKIRVVLDRACPVALSWIALSAAIFLPPSMACASAQVNVLTHRNDLTRMGQNTNETILTLANVNSNSFGKLFAYSVDGHVYAQPLYVSGVVILGQGMRNVVYVATQHNGVYAFDADSNSGLNVGVIWQTKWGTSAVMPNSDLRNPYSTYHDINPEVGITGTPVIDLASGTIYLDAFTHEGSSYFHRIHALNITNGIERPFGPVLVSASVPGGGVGSSGGVVTLVHKQHLQRSALSLAGGKLFVAY